MARLYHSPSGVKTMQSCMRKAAYQYIDKLRSPTTPAQQMGLWVHAIAEDYMSGAQVSQARWASLPGQIFQHALPALPERRACSYIRTERELGRVKIPYPAPPEHEDAPTQCFAFEGLRWVGYVDLTYRLRTGHLVVCDYKTSSDPKRWGLTTSDLPGDLQAATYAYETLVDRRDEYARMLRGDGTLDLLWLYMRTGKSRRTIPVHGRVSATQATDVLGAASLVAKEFDMIERSCDAPQTVSACGEYGGCEYHSSVGGPCVVRRGFKVLLNLKPRPKATNTTLTTENEDDMALSAANKAKFDRMRKKTASKRGKRAEEAEEAEEVEEEEEEAEEVEEEEEEVEEETAPKGRRARPSRNRSRAKKSPSDKLRALADELEKLDARREEIRAEISGILDGE